MNKKTFLEKLEKNLKGLSKEEIKDILFDFEEYFAVGIQKNRIEEELSSSLGDPRVLAKQLKAASYIKKAEENTSAGNIARAVFTSIGLSFFNLVFILPLFIVIIALFAALFACSVTISAAGVTGFVSSIFYPVFSNYLAFTVNPAVGIFAFLGITALGVLFFIGNVYLSKAMYKAIVRYLKFNLNIIKGRRKQDEH
ncbi:MAG TPA: DUF1700 domain-containing protein [Actinobacteria bacterium]|jgi:uncharacterized membrane protein|nr:DUF1700 domain-containing protein [Actinomycetota bacterium]